MKGEKICDPKRSKHLDRLSKEVETEGRVCLCIETGSSHQNFSIHIFSSYVKLRCVSTFNEQIPLDDEILIISLFRFWNRSLDISRRELKVGEESCTDERHKGRCCL